VIVVVVHEAMTMIVDGSRDDGDDL
jgi:hypothetical protein